MKLDRGGLERLADDTACVLVAQMWRRREGGLETKLPFDWRDAAEEEPVAEALAGTEAAKFLPAYSAIVVATLWGYISA